MTNEPLEFGIPIYLPLAEPLDLVVKNKRNYMDKKKKKQTT